MFPKAPAGISARVVVADIQSDDVDAQMTARALEGLVNQSSAEIYLLNRPNDIEQLIQSGRTFIRLPQLPGTNGGLRSLFKNFGPRVQKLMIYDREEDWSWNLALMAGAQQGGIPVTASLEKSLIREFNWKGDTVDFRNQWANRTQAYDWALANLMPNCTKKVLFALQGSMSLADYVVSSKGFAFWLDFDSEQDEIARIFNTRGYGVGTSLMGYASNGDEANRTANFYGVGYVISDYYSNGSFWSSFPDKIYSQAPGRIVPTQAGKIYVSLIWSDGDNICFDQDTIYHLWKDPARGTVPVGTELSPTLQELNSPLLDWYYSSMTTNDELMAGPCGVQFIYGDSLNAQFFPFWCDTNALWLADAGFQTVCLWDTQFMWYNYLFYIRTCGMSGIFLRDNPQIFDVVGVVNGLGMPVVDNSMIGGADDIYNQLSQIIPNDQFPLFRNFTCRARDFERGDGRGYASIEQQVKRLEDAYPGRFVFLLPKDQFATIRAFCNLPPVPAPGFGATILQYGPSLTVDSGTVSAKMKATPVGERTSTTQ